MSTAARRPVESDPGRPAAAGRLRRYGWLGVIAIPVVGGILGVWIYGRTTDWYVMRPGVPTLERFLENPEVLRPLAKALDVPPPPDPAELEHHQVALFLEYYGLLRRHPRDTATLVALGHLFEEVGHPERAAACFRRAGELNQSPETGTEPRGSWLAGGR